MFFSRSVLIKYVLAALCSFYLTLVLHIQLRFHTFTLVLLSLLFCVLTYHLLTYLTDKSNGRVFDKKIAFAGIGLGIFLLIAVPKSFNLSSEPDTFALIKITALGQKNDSSHSTEVWISHILNKGVDYKPVLTTGWKERYNQFVSAGFATQPSTLTVKIDDPVKPEIIFNKHSWAGKVRVEEGTDTTLIDLYSTKNGQSFKYASKKVFSNEDKYLPAQSIILLLVSLLALAVLSYASILFARINNNYFLLSVPLCFATFFPANYLDITLTEKLILLALTIGCCFIVPRENANRLIREYTSRYKLIGFIVLLYAGLAFFGHHLFFGDYPLRHFINRLAFCFLFCGWFFFFALLFLYVTDVCRKKIAAQRAQLPVSYSPIKLYLFFSAILLACWSVYLVAYYPGNMTPDSLDQWYQATGIYYYNETHPAIHTLLIKLLISIWHSPAIVAISQMLTLAAACSSFLIYLYKAGIPIKWLFLACVIVGIIPANGILPVMLWKATVFCCAVLWATLTITEIVTDIYIFNYRTTLICLAISLVAVALLRHNGIVAAIVTIAFLLVWALKKRKRPLLISVGLSALAIFSYKEIILPYVLKVPPAASAFTLILPVHAMAAVKYYDGGYMPKEVDQEMKKLLPDSIWISDYRPYNADPYLYYRGPGFIRNLSKVPTTKVLQLYATTFSHNPYIVSMDRVNGSELLWNVSMAKGSFDYVYTEGIDVNNIGLKQEKNSLQPVIKKIYDYTNRYLQPVLWRPGIYNILLGFLFLSFILLRKRYFLIFLPVFGTNLSLIIAMNHQSFRYVYYIPLAFGFIWLLAISSALTPEKIKTNTNTP